LTLSNAIGHSSKLLSVRDKVTLLAFCCFTQQVGFKVMGWKVFVKALIIMTYTFGAKC